MSWQVCSEFSFFVHHKFRLNFKQNRPWKLPHNICSSCPVLYGSGETMRHFWLAGWEKKITFASKMKLQIATLTDSFVFVCHVIHQHKERAVHTNTQPPPTHQMFKRKTTFLIFITTFFVAKKYISYWVRSWVRNPPLHCEGDVFFLHCCCILFSFIQFVYNSLENTFFLFYMNCKMFFSFSFNSNLNVVWRLELFRCFLWTNNFGYIFCEFLRIILRVLTENIENFYGAFLFHNQKKHKIEKKN